MARHRAISEPVALAEAVNNVIQNSATRSAVDSSTGLTSNHRSITTGDLEWNGAQGGIAISRRFRQQNTCDHIDTTVLDPDADEDTLYDREGEPVYNGQQPRQRDSTSSTSDRTLAAIEEEGTGHDGRPVDATARQKSEGSRGANEKVGQRRWSGTAAQGIDQPGSKESAIRQWKDNVVTFDGPDDPENPKNWSYRYKVFITMLLGLTTACSTFASSVFTPALKYVSEEYDISEEVALLALSLFIIGFVPGPIVFAPLSEMYGRKWTCIVPLFVSACFAAATATAENVQMVMITRFFAGVFASAPLTIVGGSLADMWDQKQRATEVVLWSLAVVAGPNLGPIVGAALAESSLGWRWTEYIVVILNCIVLALDLLFLRETFAPVLLARKARDLRWKTGRWELHSKSEMTPISLQVFMDKNLKLPLKMLVLEPMVLCITLFTSFAYGVSYLLFPALPIIYEQDRGWGVFTGTLPFLALLLGSLTSAVINAVYSQKFFAKKVEREGHAAPEWRLPPMILGSICFPVGFFLTAWTSRRDIQWFPSVLGLYFVGMSFLLIFQGGLNYLLDAYTASATSAVAANTFLRSAVAGALPLVTRPMYNNLGVDWACTLLGCVCLLLAAIPIFFFKYGAKLRAMSRLAKS